MTKIARPLKLSWIAAAAGLLGAPASAEDADWYRGGWRTDAGEPRVYQFVIRGDAVTGYTCSAGTVSGSLCISTSVYNATVTGYQCNPGDSLSGTTCTHTTTSSYGASIGSYAGS